MINPLEVRRNNLLMHGHDIATVRGLPADDFIQYSIESRDNEIVYGEPYESFDPIELTEEWLIELGFNRIGKSNDFYKGNFFIHKRKIGWVINKRIAPIKFVHTLQNTYFCFKTIEL